MLVQWKSEKLLKSKGSYLGQSLDRAAILTSQADTLAVLHMIFFSYEIFYKALFVPQSAICCSSNCSLSSICFVILFKKKKEKKGNLSFARSNYANWLKCSFQSNKYMSVSRANLKKNGFSTDWRTTEVPEYTMALRVRHCVLFSRFSHK